MALRRRQPGRCHQHPATNPRSFARAVILFRTALAALLVISQSRLVFPDGTELPSASADVTMKVCDARTGHRILSLNGHYNLHQRYSTLSRPQQPLYSHSLNLSRLLRVALGESRDKVTHLQFSEYRSHLLSVGLTKMVYGDACEPHRKNMIGSIDYTSTSDLLEAEAAVDATSVYSVRYDR